MVSVNSPFWEALPDDVMEMLYFFDEFFMNKSVCKGDDPGPADRSKQLIQSANGSIPSSFSQSTIVQRSRSGKSTRCAPEGGGEDKSTVQVLQLRRWQRWHTKHRMYI